jgi:hypothetical protein
MAVSGSFHNIQRVYDLPGGLREDQKGHRDWSLLLRSPLGKEDFL